MILIIIGWFCVIGAVISELMLIIRAAKISDWNNELSWAMNRNIALYLIAAAICFK